MARQVAWLAVALLAATAVLATPGAALGATDRADLMPPATAAAAEPQEPSDNWRVIVLAVVGAVAVTLRRTTTPAGRSTRPIDD
jgi:hypothetical protein